MKKMLINSQLTFSLCNIVVSVFIIILSLNNSLLEYNRTYGLAHLFNCLMFSIFFGLKLTRKIKEKVGIYLIASIFLIGEIFEIELLDLTQISPGFWLFLYVRLVSTLMVIRIQTIKLLILIITFTYIIIRLHLYDSLLSYMGIIYIHTLFQTEQEEQNPNELINFIQFSIDSPMLILEAKSLNPIFNNKALEDEFKYNKDESKEFVESLLNFQSESQQKLYDLLQNFKQVPICKGWQNWLNINVSKFDIIEQEQLINYSYRKSIKTNLIEQQEYDQFHEIKNQIESPKYHELKPSIQQISEESPKQKQKKYVFSQFKDQSNELIKSPICQRRLNIHYILCRWNGQLSIILQLKDNDEINQIKELENRVQQLIQINQNKDQILASVFHDFKTPINGIVGLLETLEESQNITSQQKLYYSIIKKNIYMMIYMINDILDYARIEKNQLKLCLSEFYINEIVEEVIELITMQAQQKGVEIHTHYDIPTYQIYSDPNRLKQILMNMMSNSLKFTQQGSITINIESLFSDRSSHIIREASQKTVKCSTPHQLQKKTIGQLRKQLSGRSIKTNQNNYIYQITITDTGCGISDSIKPKLFNMFATFSGKNINNTSGTGIGLMICKKLVKLLGPTDKIELESEEHKGTTMSFKIFARMPDLTKNSPNYICVYKEESSQKLQDRDQVLSNSSEEQKFVRSSVFRLYRRIQSTNTESIDVVSEDFDDSKMKNMNELIKSSTRYRITNLQNHHLEYQQNQLRENSQEIIDPIIRIKQILSHNKFSVMIVDDEPFNVFSFKLLLQNANSDIQIIEAYNGKQAIEKLQQFQNSYDIKIMFLDLCMPIMNGWQTAIKIREMINEKQIQPLYLVALTGFGLDDEQEQHRCENLGFTAFITKPIKLEIVAEIFHHLSSDLL